MSKIQFETLSLAQLQSAAQYIDAHEIPKERESRDYDAWIDGKTYPPLYLLAIVNREMGGELLTPSDFGSSIDKAFEYIEQAGGSVMPKWVALFREIRDKLATYDAESSGELIPILKQIGIPSVTNDKNEAGETIPLEEIDPFSFIRCFTKYQETQRAEYFKKLKEIWYLKTPIPKEYPGVPIANAQNVWLFPYKHTRKEEDIPVLWKLFEEMLAGDVQAATFERALQIKMVGNAKLTESMFNYDPFHFLCLNSVTNAYIKEKKISADFQTFQEYLDIQKKVKQQYRANFVTVSHDAFLKRQKRETQYFFFKANPKHWDLVQHLKNGTVEDWSVTKLQKELSIGDKVMLWKTGEKEGIYALAEITTEIFQRDMIEEELAGDWKDDASKTKLEKIGIEITHNLVEQPILWEELEASGLFKRIPQGTNFRAKKEQYDFILKSVNKREKSPATQDRQYFKCSPGENSIFWGEFKNEKIIALGWDDIGDYKDYSDRYEVGEALGMESPYSKPPLSIDDFTHKAKIGDVVFAAQGLNSILDIGFIEGPCIFDPQKTKNKNFRKVKWLGLKVLNLQDKVEEIRYTNLFQPIAFHRVNPYAFILNKYVEEYPEYAEIFDLYDLPYQQAVVEATVPTASNSKYENPNIILYGPPGTGKTYSTIDLAVEIATGEDLGHDDNKKVFDKLRASGQIEFITFHQSYAYEDFVVSMRPDPDSDTLKFLQHKGIFYEMCRIAKRNFEAATKGTGKKRSFEEVFQEFLQPLEEGQVEKIPVKMKAGKTFYITEVSDKSIAFEMPSGSSSYTMSISTLKDLVEGVRELGSGLVSYYSPLVELIRSKQETKEKAEPRKNYVLIIDEINRGNISRIFGELITLLEDDKRLGEKNELRVTLPNGEKGFGVPPNLYLIGTMNTADKSIALLDIALRRRFEFIGKYPVYDDLTPMVQEKLEKLNEAITEAKKSPDFMIGHAYFIDKPDDDFPKIMNRKIIPLLYEYFNGRAEFVKRILDSAEISVKKNPISHSWEAKAQ